MEAIDERAVRTKIKLAKHYTTCVLILRPILPMTVDTVISIGVRRAVQTADDMKTDILALAKGCQAYANPHVTGNQLLDMDPALCDELSETCQEALVGGIDDSGMMHWYATGDAKRLRSYAQQAAALLLRT